MTVQNERMKELKPQCIQYLSPFFLFQFVEECTAANLFNHVYPCCEWT